MLIKRINAHVAQLVEHFLGKEEVHRFNAGRGLQYHLCALAFKINLLNMKDSYPLRVIVKG
jgi:hypothetical protein